MFICRACWRRALGSSPASFSAQNSLRSAPRIPSALRPLEKRQLATATATATRPIQTLDLSSQKRVEDEDEVESNSMSSAFEARQRVLQWRVKKHLEHLTNNYKIAEHVERTLDRGEFEEASMLVRQASKTQNVTVAWNHLIDYQMRQQRLHAAVKLYNEMKKRNQLPNAQSYTILFRGFANSIHPKLAVSEAVRIYHTMMNSKRLQPNTIHMNAVLGACARAEDLESMFSIVSTVDDKLRTPNSRTYTLILNALRPKDSLPHVRRRREFYDDEENSEAQKAADVAVINQGKAIWEEVIRRWRKAKLVIDEQLVCAMGRLLGTGGREENEEILSLVEQTMRIPKPAEVDASDFLPSPEGAQEPTTLAVNQKPTTTLVTASDHPLAKLNTGNYAQPGNNTLSMIIQSLNVTRKTTLGPKYWDLFVNKLHVSPDSASYHTYLRLLRTGRASTEAAKVIESMPHDLLAAKTFRLGISTCIKDNLNQHAFSNATRIFRVMTTKTKAPDAHSMRMYLHATRANHRHFKDMPNGKFKLGRQIAIALDNMWEPFGQLSRSFSFSLPEAKSPAEEWVYTLNERMEAIAVARRMVAAMDFIVTEQAGSDTMIKILRTRRNVLNNHIIRFNEKYREMEDMLSDRSKGGKNPLPDKMRWALRKKMNETFKAMGEKLTGDGFDEEGKEEVVLVDDRKDWEVIV